MKSGSVLLFFFPYLSELKNQTAFIHQGKKKKGCRKHYAGTVQNQYLMFPVSGYIRERVDLITKSGSRPLSLLWRFSADWIGFSLLMGYCFLLRLGHSLFQAL